MQITFLVRIFHSAPMIFNFVAMVKNYCWVDNDHISHQKNEKLSRNHFFPSKICWYVVSFSKQ